MNDLPKDVQSASGAKSGVRTDEKKQHFDDIYVQNTPVPFKEWIIDALDYISDDNNRQAFDRLLLPFVEDRLSKGLSVDYLDLCCCFGNTTMACVNGMSVAEIRENWKNEAAAQQVMKPRRFAANITGIDISENALAYATSAGIVDKSVAVDLNSSDDNAREATAAAMRQADVVVSTASLVYLELEAIEFLLDAFREKEEEGMMMVNFLNPFALEKADATKKLLLEKLEFVGSTAARHRKLSALERENYPGEEWALLEIWILRRPG